MTSAALAQSNLNADLKDGGGAEVTNKRQGASPIGAFSAQVSARVDASSRYVSNSGCDTHDAPWTFLEDAADASASKRSVSKVPTITGMRWLEDVVGKHCGQTDLPESKQGLCGLDTRGDVALYGIWVESADMVGADSGDTIAASTSSCDRVGGCTVNLNDREFGPPSPLISPLSHKYHSVESHICATGGWLRDSGGWLRDSGGWLRDSGGWHRRIRHYPRPPFKRNKLWRLTSNSSQSEDE
ncbi:hypothetical protein DFH06DRAFT_1298012 [Mycena polygramma]|nr:hypothetical protein DFH06DRAFT_1298012 [Mycena polygramma]